MTTMTMLWRLLCCCLLEMDATKLDKLIQKTGSVLGRRLHSLKAVVKKRMWTNLAKILDNIKHPLHRTLMKQSSSHSGRLTVL